MSPIDYSAHVIVELLPSYKSLLRDEDASSFALLLDLLKEISLRVGKHRYSKEALHELVKKEFLLGKSIFDLTEIIGNTAYCIFPTAEDDPMFFRSVFQNPTVLRSAYGNEPYVAPVSPVTPVVPPVTPVAPVRRTLNVPSPNNTVRPEHVGDLPEIVALKRKYFELEKPNEKYYWKWRVSTEDYNEFKSLLLGVGFSDRTRAKVRECAYQLCFYIAEWYKREYNGNESDNCLGELGIGSDLTRLIWEGSHPDGKQPYITSETNIHEWLYSIYVLGGFPIKYTLRANHFSSLFDEIWGEDQDRDTISDEQIDEITQDFSGNQVMKDSLVQGSLHDYYRYLRKENDMPIAASDRNKDPFVGFIRKLQEGRKKYYEQYLKPTWLLYVDSHDSLVEGEVQVSFGRKEDKCYIPVECLSYWRIPDARTLEGFEMVLSDSSSGEERSIRFSKTGPGDYPFVGWSRTNCISLPLSLDGDCHFEVHLVTSAGRYKIGNAFSFGDSRQFYKTKRPYEWSSRTDNSVHTAVLFNPAKLSLRDSSFPPEEKCFQEGGKVWNWLILTEEVTLDYGSGRDPLKYSPRNSSLEMVFKLIKNTIKYVNFRDVVYHQLADGEDHQSLVTLLMADGFSMRYTPYGEDTPRAVPLDQCDVYFKRPGDGRFIPWDASNPPRQGIMQLRVVYREKGISTTRLVFYLPEKIPIRRIKSRNLILFEKGLENVYAPEAERYRLLEVNGDGCFYYHDDVVAGYSPQSDFIPFLLGDQDKEYVIINVYRSAKCKELYLKGEPKPLKRYDQEVGLVDIPVILRRNFEVRTIDREGVSRVRCGDDVYMRFDTMSPYVDSENALQYYTLTESRTIVNDADTYATFVLETSPAQYRFFYWSMNVEDEPVALDQIGYDPDTKHLKIDITPLRKNKRGIVFQSLKGVAPRHYFAPIRGAKEVAGFGLQKMRVKCFDVASEHGIPFVLFPRLKELFFEDDVVPGSVLGGIDEFKRLEAFLSRLCKPPSFCLRVSLRLDYAA